MKLRFHACRKNGDIGALADARRAPKNLFSRKRQNYFLDGALSGAKLAGKNQKYLPTHYNCMYKLYHTYIIPPLKKLICTGGKTTLCMYP